MPRSKRNRVLPTSKVKKNHKDLAKRLHSSIQTALDTYAYIYVFSVTNMRNNALKSIRSELSDSRIFMGKTKLMAHALGTTPETAYTDGVEKLSPHLTGEVGLLFTNRTPTEVEDFFSTRTERDYARAGTVADEAFTIPHGELTTKYGVEGGQDDPLPMSIEPTLRKLGVPTRLVRGKVVLEEGAEEGFGMESDGYVVCREGDTLDSRQTTILKIFGVRMAEFRVQLRASFEKESATVKEIGEMEVDA